MNVTLKIDLYSWRLLVYWTGIQFIAGYPLPFPSIFSGFHDSSIVPLLLGEEKHCESKVHGQKMQHNDSARSWTQTSWTIVQCKNIRPLCPPQGQLLCSWSITIFLSMKYISIASKPLPGHVYNQGSKIN